MHRPRKRFGQHFLHDRATVAAIIAAIDPQPEDRLVEIGPGLEALTAPLLDRLPHLTVVEIDRDIVARLRTRYASDRLTVLEADALEVDFGTLGDALRLVGNLPYNISTPLLFHLMPAASSLRDLHFMLQREVVDRMVAQPGSAAYGRLSVMLQYRFVLEKIRDVAPGAFSPPPKVQSAVVRMVPRPLAELGANDERALATVVTSAFTKRRKTLRNSLADHFSSAAMEALGIDPGRRAEELDVHAYVRLANALGAREARA